MWKEVTNEALPTFDNINNASTLWLWGVVQKNSDNYELMYEEIQEKAKDLFGTDFNIEFPKEGTSNFVYNEENKKYNTTGIKLDAKEDKFLLNKITKNKNGYEVEIVEYLEEYIEQQDEQYVDNTDNTENTNNKVIIENLNGEQISTIENKTEETQVQQIVKDNLDKFSKKKITLKKDEKENLYVEKVETI